MTETFEHLFGGWNEAQARRWRNPDGSEGGIVAADARIDSALTIPADAVVWPRASIGYGARIGDGASIGDGARIGDGASIGPRASIGDGASIGVQDWWLSGGPCGSRDAFWIAVWSPQHGVRWWVGCQWGLSTAELCARVEAQHGTSAHGDDYRAVIAFVEGHPGLARAKAKLASEATS